MTVGTVTGMTTHAAGYDRQSAERASGSTASPASQRAANKGEADRRKAQGLDLTWVGHYSEAPGTSAFTGVDRPEFNRLLDDCRRGKVNMLIVSYVSRLSRLEPLDAIPIVTEILNLGVVIVSVNEGEFRKGNMMDLIHLIMRLDAAHNESRNKSISVKNSKDLARALGGHVGRIPYGFGTVQRMVPNPADNDKLVAIQVLVHGAAKWDGKHQAEPEVIRWMWREIKKHKDTPFKGGGAGSFHPGSLHGLVTRLWRDGVPTRGSTVGKRSSTSEWDTSVVKRILRDPRIAGYRARVTYKTKPDGKRGGFAGYRIERDPVTMKPLLLECGPIIPPAEWHELQEWLDGRGRGKGLYRGQSLLSAMGVLYCAGSGATDPETGYGDGATMSGNVRADHSGSRKDSYACKCKKRVHEGSSCSIAIHLLDPYIADRIFALIKTAEGDEDTMLTLHEAAKRWGKLTEAPEKAGERAQLVADRADAARGLEELYEDRAAGAYKGTIGRKAFMKEEAALTFRMQGAEERLRELEDAQNPLLPIWEWLPEDPDADPTGPGSWWDSASLADKREFIRLFIDRIEVRKTAKGAYRPGRVPDVRSRVTVHWAEPADSDENEHEEAA